MPVVSIIVPCYNQAEFLPETLESVLAQTYPDWECIIVNDGSPDNTELVALEFAAKDSRFVYLSQENQGLAMSRNNGIHVSSGKYILPLDSDDLIAPTYVEKAVAYLELHPECDLVYSKAQFFGKENGLWQMSPYSFEDLLWENLIFCSAVFRRDIYDGTGGYNPNMRYGYEDWDFWLSYLTPESVVFQIDEPLFFYRKKGISMLTSIGNRHDDLCRIIYSNHKDLYEPFCEGIISLRNHSKNTDRELDAVYSSFSYKIGRAIVSPIGKLRDKFKFVLKRRMS